MCNGNIKRSEQASTAIWKNFELLKCSHNDFPADIGQNHYGKSTDEWWQLGFAMTRNEINVFETNRQLICQQEISERINFFIKSKSEVDAMHIYR